MEATIVPGLRGLKIIPTALSPFSPDFLRSSLLAFLLVAAKILSMFSAMYENLRLILH